MKIRKDKNSPWIELTWKDGMEYLENMAREAEKTISEKNEIMRKEMGNEEYNKFVIEHHIYQPNQ